MDEAIVESKGIKATMKLHSMLRDLEEVNDIHVASERRLLEGNLESHNIAAIGSDLQNNNKCNEDNHQEKDKEKNRYSGRSLLGKEVDLNDDDIAIEEDDGWLLKTPSAEDKPERKSRFWLSDDIRTPELNRVKGSLASKVDLILIQTRKEKLTNLLAKHNLGSHPESAPGRLYQAESMCSVMSMDWEYDEDFGLNNHARSVGSFSDSPMRRRGESNQYFDGNQFDDLQPMTLDFDLSPVAQNLVHVDQGHMLTRRTGIGSHAIKPRQIKASSFKSNDSGITNQVRRPSFSDKSDSSGDFPSSPRSSLGSSRNSLDSAEGTSNRRGKLSGKRMLLPIASFFDGPIPEEDLGFENDHSSKILNPYAAWDVMRDHNIVSNHGMQKSSSSLSQADPTSTVKLPMAASDGPVIRRRGASPKTSPMSKDTAPRPRLSNQGVVLRSRDQTESSTQSNTQMVRPKTAQPLTRKSLLPSQKRLTQNPELSQSPDIVPRKESSPNRRSQSPDLIPRKSGVVRRGQASSRSYQA